MEKKAQTQQKPGSPQKNPQQKPGSSPQKNPKK
jgi:hypothetical protein